jgi:enoyl-[acyl-carrier-protein] reductase (NADH)
MDRVIAKEAEASGITANALRQEGYADCVSASLKRFVSAEGIADMALFMAPPMARSVSGMNMAVDGHIEQVTI